jgi:hypothetical protein
MALYRMNLKLDRRESKKINTEGKYILWKLSLRKTTRLPVEKFQRVLQKH